MLDALFYVLREGCQWRAIPHDYGVHWFTVYDLFRPWSADGTLETIHAVLRGQVRKRAGKEPTPSAGALDSQSVKTSAQGGVRGYDAGKLVNGRKRHIFVDTLGMLWAVVVHSAGIQDYDGGKLVLEKAKNQTKLPRLKVLWSDSRYTSMVEWVASACQWLLEVVRKPKGATGFVRLPHRWIVERTFAWFGNFRRLDKDHEVLPEVSEAMCYWAMVHLMARRLTGGQTKWTGRHRRKGQAICSTG